MTTQQRQSSELDPITAAAAGVIGGVVVALVLGALLAFWKTGEYIIGVYFTHARTGQPGAFKLRRALIAVLVCWAVAAVLGWSSFLVSDPVVPFGIALAIDIVATLTFVGYVVYQAHHLASLQPREQPLSELDSYLAPFVASAVVTPEPIPNDGVGQVGYVPRRRAPRRLLKVWALGWLPYVLYVAAIIVLGTVMALLAQFGFEQQARSIMDLPIPSGDWTIPFGLVVMALSTAAFSIYALYIGARRRLSQPMARPESELHTHLPSFVAAMPEAPTTPVASPLTPAPLYVQDLPQLHSPA